jgi:hypothetical protein
MRQLAFASPARWPALLFAAAMLALAPVHQASAKDLTAKQFLQGIYASYMGSDAYGIAWRGPKASRYFDDTLTKLIAKDIAQSEGEVGRLGADPFVDAQDFDIPSVKIEVTVEDAAEAKAAASFTNMSQRTRVEYDLVKTPRGWRIANITWPSRSEDLRSILSGPPPSN